MSDQNILNEDQINENQTPELVSESRNNSPELLPKSRNKSSDLSGTDVRKSPDDTPAPPVEDANEGDTEVRTPAEKDEQDTVSEGDPNETPEGETFSRSYVEKLRKESAKYRDRAKQVDEITAERDGLARRLHAALVASDGRLADPTDLEFDAAHLEDGQALSQAIGDLIARKPGLRARKIGGDVGAGKRGTPKTREVDLINIIRDM